MCRIKEFEKNVYVTFSKKKQVANSNNIKMHTKHPSRSQNNFENLIMMNRMLYQHYSDLSSDERHCRPRLLRKSASMPGLVRDVIDTDVHTNHHLHLSDHIFQLLKASKMQFLLNIDGKEHLRWYRTGIKTEHSKFIANRLVNNFVVRSLDISYNPVGDKGIFYLCMALEQNSTLENLNLDATGITDAGAADIAALFRSEKNFSLAVLGLSQNSISYDGMILISEALENNTTLRTLTVDQETDPASLGKKKAIIEINKLSGNEFKKGSMSFDIYKKESKSICLYRKNFNTYHMIIATPMLAKNHLLTDLNISHNAIGDGIEYFSKMLATNTTIRKLNLSNCMISDGGVRHIADALTKNFVLVNLNIAQNKFTEIGVHFLSFALKENKENSLHSLTLTYNSLNIQKFRGNAALLNCHRKKYYDFDAIIIASLVSCNASLRRLILTENYIGDKGAKAIASALNCNNVLEFLDLSGNMIGHLGVGAMNTVRNSLKVVLKNMRILDKCSVS